MLLSALASAFTIKPGDKVPMADLHFGFPPLNVNTAEYLAGRNVIVAGLPGAFTPTCSSKQVPGYLEAQDELKAAGVDEVLGTSDGFDFYTKSWFIFGLL